MNSLAYAGYILALIGGIIIVIIGVLGFFGSALLIFSPLAFFGGVLYSAAHIVIGIICIIGSRYVSTLGWGIALLILGLIAGAGGALVILGAILGLISTLMKNPP